MTRWSAPERSTVGPVDILAFDSELGLVARPLISPTGGFGGPEGAA